MPEGTNALLAPNVSSYSNPTVNALLAAGGSGSNTMDAGTSNALQVANQAQQLQSGKVTIDTQTYNLAKAKMDSLHQIYQSIVDNPDPDNVTWQIGQAVKAGTIDPQQGTDAASKMASFGGDRAKIQQFALNGMNVNQSHQEALEQAYGAPSLVNRGGSLDPVRVVQGPGAGVYGAGGAALPVTASPGQKMAGVSTVDGNGATVFRPNSTLYDDRGNFRGDGSAPSIPVYRGGGGGAPPESNAPPPLVGGNRPPPMTAGAMPPAGQAQGGSPMPQGQGGAAGAPAGTAGAMVTPNPQTLPVITPAMNDAAVNAYRNGEQTAANRNIMRGFAVQNNLPYLKHMGAFEPQPAGVGAAAPVSVRQTGGAGGPAAPVGQPPAPVQAPGAGQGGGLGQGAGGGLVTGLSPGQEASLKAGADTYSALSSDVTNPNGSNSRVFKIGRALDAIRNTTTGRGTAMRQEMLGTLDALPGGLGRLFPGVDPQSITNYDLATKYTNAIAQSSPGALRSDAGQSLAASANASTNGMTQQAATDVLTNQLGQERMNQAQLRAFNAAGLDPGQFPKWSAQWARNVDPRAFALADMTPDERTAVWAGLKGPARNAFAASVSKAIAGGVYTRADIMNAGGAANGR